MKYLVSVFLIIGVSFISLAQKKKRQKQQKVSTIITTARSYLGTPYKWGGQSKSGIDCSGLVQNSYRAVDIKLPRTAKEQSKVGKKRRWQGIQPGDVVYFKFKNKKEKWWHSGIITEVSPDRIRFIHASSSRGVLESNLMSDYYRKRVKNFRRVIK